MVCPGGIISGGHVRHSILSPNVRVNSYAVVEDSILFEGVRVGRKCKVRRAIIDKDVELPEGAEVGYDLDLDRRRGFTITESGIVVIAKGEPASTFYRGEGRIFLHTASGIVSNNPATCLHTCRSFRSPR